MQTFLPYPSFTESARVLDNRQPAVCVAGRMKMNFPLTFRARSVIIEIDNPLAREDKKL
jgi:hypothetical protein